ncbi:MAG: hypothetical protein HY332_23550 [Chloroflexi bacterium]|nr:hypothetical protein [Chloroflexota bacterium]
MPLTPWIFVQDPLERWLADYRRTFDAWHDGGVRGIVVGYLRWRQDDGSMVPCFSVDPSAYSSFGVPLPPETPRDPDKERLFSTMLDDAAARGWEILFFGARTSARLGPVHPLPGDPFGAAAYAAGVQSALSAYPQAQGWVIDGAGEHHYELAFHHDGELFEIREHERRWLEALGADVDRMERGIAHLRDRFHRLTPSLVRYHTPAGLLAGLALFDLTEDALYWLRMRRETALAYMAAVREQIARIPRAVKLGAIPRTATFSALATQDYHRMPRYFDYIFPKHYFWHRGFDGMYGTVARWVRRLGDWNPRLSEADCFAVVKAWFGLQLPGIESLADMEMGFPDAFFTEVVATETRRALAAVGDPNRVIAWVSSGRQPHAGDPMPARDLYRILTVSEEAGLRRFIYHPAGALGAAEWSTLSRLCGTPWRENPDDPNAYWPPDTPKPDTFGGGRVPQRRG